MNSQIRARPKVGKHGKLAYNGILLGYHGEDPGNHAGTSRNADSILMAQESHGAFVAGCQSRL